MLKGFKELPGRNKHGLTLDAWLKSGRTSAPDGFSEWSGAQMYWKRGDLVDFAIGQYRDTDLYRHMLTQKGKVLAAICLRR